MEQNQECKKQKKNITTFTKNVSGSGYVDKRTSSENKSEKQKHGKEHG